MRTDQLIDMLSTNLEPVEDRKLETALLWAIVGGGAVTFCVMLSTVSLRNDLDSAAGVGFVVLKLLFAAAVIGTGLAFLGRSLHPGQETRTSLRRTWLPLAILGIAAFGELALGVSTRPHPMTAGTHWILCLYCIPLFATIPFVLLIWALRGGAPTHLVRTGAVAGVVAGAIGAAAYAFHCPDDLLPFIALWYGLSIALCGAVGAMLGPRLLRW